MEGFTLCIAHLCNNQSAADVAENCSGQQIAAKRKQNEVNELSADIELELTLHADRFRQFYSVTCGPTQLKRPGRK